MSTTNLSPAELVRQRLAEAERRAWQAHWDEFEAENRAYQVERFGKFLGWTHGKPGTYSNGCRCAQCREAWRVYMNDYNRRRREANPKPKREVKGRGREIKPHMHGTLTGYSYGCRCQECTEAHRIARPLRSIKNHGTEYGYKKGCRCRGCTKASSEARSKRYRQRLSTEPPESAHGTEYGYTGYGCRCTPCVEAKREVSKARKQRKKLQND